MLAININYDHALRTNSNESRAEDLQVADRQVRAAADASDAWILDALTAIIKVVNESIPDRHLTTANNEHGP